MADTEQFAHSSLGVASRQIRLVRISPGTLNEQVICELHTVDIGATPVYTALSYCWGQPPSTKEISINRRRFLVRQNLYDFLLVASTRYQKRLFWIDQICIDQDNVEERNQQLRLMPRIYGPAVETFIWMGAAAGDSEWILKFIRSWRQPLFNMHELSKHEEVALRHMFLRPYWNRLWIVQEVKLARDKSILSGTECVSWRKFLSFVDYHISASRRYMVSENAQILLGFNEYTNGLNPKGPPFNLSFPYFGITLAGSARYRLSHLVFLYCHFQCADARDKIYGLVGMVLESDSRSHSEKIEVDYGKSAEEVYLDFIEIGLAEHLRNPPVKAERGDVLADWFDFGVRLMHEMGLHSERMEAKLFRTIQSISISQQKDGLGSRRQTAEIRRAISA